LKISGRSLIGLKHLCKSYERNRKQKIEKVTEQKKEEEGSHWADPKTGPAQ
jgi:hypothetical protein